MEFLIILIVIIIIVMVIINYSSKSRSPKQQTPTIYQEYLSSQKTTRTLKTDYGQKAISAKWYTSIEDVNVQGHNLTGGLVYVGTHLPDTYGYSNDACLINPRLPVITAEPWEFGDEMGYWPQYAEISPRCRGAYLKWLSTGRNEPRAYTGYVFLFFYGLERRLIVDGQKGLVSEDERLDIVNELLRLLKIYGNNNSFRGYATNLLAMEWVLYQIEKPVPNYVDLNDSFCMEPFQVVLAQHVAEGRPIPAEVALQWILVHPELYLRTPARRCPAEFRALFYPRYKEKYGDGILVKPNKTRLKLTYYSASPSLRGNLNLKIPDLPNPFILTGPVKKIMAIIDDCTNELDPYSRYIGRAGNDPESLSSKILLPIELFQKTPEAKRLYESFRKLCEKSYGLINLEKVYVILDESPPPKILKKEAEKIAAILEGVGFGIVPDVRFHNIKPDLEGEVVIFPGGHGKDFQPSKEFRMMCIILRLGALVSQIDNDLSPAEEALLQDLVQSNRELFSIEKESLLAYLYWCLRTPQNTNGLKQKFTIVSDAEKEAISRILISVTLADGRIDPREIQVLEKLYTTLGLDKGLVATDIHTLEAGGGPVLVETRSPDTSFAIPKSESTLAVTKGFELNTELINIRKEETRQVKGVLEEIFSEQSYDEVEESAIAVESETGQNPIDKLDRAHQQFYMKLLSKNSWMRKELHELSQENGLLLDGAMEVINEWAYEIVNAPLIDDGDPVYVDVELSREIMNA